MIGALCIFRVAAQSPYCTSNTRFTELPFFSATDIISDTGIVYGSALSYQGNTQILKLNIFYPNLALDTFSKRPLIVLLHGGGFINGTLKGLNNECIEFAKRGFVAATVEYRLGWNYGTSGCGGDPASQRLAVYRGIQDEHAAIRYLVANANTYKIDTAWIFAGGNSAGSFASVNLAFVSQQAMNIAYPDLQQTLGDINASGNSLTNTFSLKGLYHNWGSILDINAINSNNAIPLVGFAGDQDNISPIDSGYWRGCTNYTLTWGSRAIYNKLTSFGVCADLSVQLGSGHGVWKDTPAQDLFRIQRATCFFKSLFCNTCATSYLTDSIPANCSMNTTSIESGYSTQTTKIFPNPFSNKIIYQNSGAEQVSFKLLNSLGSIVWKGNHIEQQDFSALPSGIYFLEIEDSNHKQVVKLAK